MIGLGNKDMEPFFHVFGPLSFGKLPISTLANFSYTIELTVKLEFSSQHSPSNRWNFFGAGWFQVFWLSRGQIQESSMMP